MSIERLDFSLDVQPLREELAVHPDVWDQYRWRTEHPRSPHRECSDVWLRYNALQNIGQRFNDEHESVWYPAAEQLPAARTLCEAVMAARQNDRLAGVLLTRIPAGGQVYPHIDLGWHAEQTEKFGVLVQGNAQQRFCFEGAELRSTPGDCFTFNNQTKHWVINDSAEDRMTLIVCLRRTH